MLALWKIIEDRPSAEAMSAISDALLVLVEKYCLTVYLLELTVFCLFV